MGPGERNGMSDDVLDDLLAAAHERDGFRSFVHYHGDDYDVRYKREDVEEAYTSEEFDEIVKNLVLAGLDERRDQTEFNRWGHMDIGARWFHTIVVLHVPLGDWEGAFATFDREKLTAYGSLLNDVLNVVEQGMTAGPDDETVADHFS